MHLALAHLSPLLAKPATPLGFTTLATGLMLIAGGYCFAHGLVSGGSVHPALSLSWGAAATFPWWCAWEGTKRLGMFSSPWLRPLLVAILLLAALATCASLEIALTTAFYGEAGESMAEAVYRLMPIAVALALASAVLARRAPAAPPVQASEPEPQQEELILSVPARHGTVTLSAADIEYVKAAGNYVELVVGERTWLLRTTLVELARKLEAVGFVRVHRSLIVNTLHVVTQRRAAQGRRVLQLRSGAKVPVGRQFRAATDSLVERRLRDDDPSQRRLHPNHASTRVCGDGSAGRSLSTDPNRSPRPH